MSLFENGFKGGLGSGVLIGLGALVLGPVVGSLIGAVLKPVAKAAIMGGLIIYDQGRKFMAEVRESGEDLVAESRAELAGGREQPGRASAGDFSTGGTVQTGAAEPSQGASSPGETHQEEHPRPWIVRGY